MLLPQAWLQEGALASHFWAKLYQKVSESDLWPLTSDLFALVVISTEHSCHGHQEHKLLTTRSRCQLSDAGKQKCNSGAPDLKYEMISSCFNFDKLH